MSVIKIYCRCINIDSWLLQMSALQVRLYIWLQELVVSWMHLSYSEGVLKGGISLTFVSDRHTGKRNE